MTHYEILLWTCYFCFGKGDGGGLSPKLQDFIVRTIFAAYIQYAEFLPRSACKSCRAKAGREFNFLQHNYECKNSNQIVAENQSVQRTLLSLGSDGSDCMCFTCSKARGRKGKLPVSSPAPTPAPVPTPAPIQTPGPSDASAPTPGSSKAEMDQFLDALTPKTKGRFVAREIKRRQSEVGSNTVQVQQMGSPLTVSTGAIPKQPKKVSLDTLKNIQKDTGCSDRTLLTVRKHINLDQGKRTFEPGLEKMLSEGPKEMRQFFKKVPLTLEKSGVMVDRIYVYCKDLPGLLNYMRVKRNLTPQQIEQQFQTLEKISMDGGGGFFKICLNMVRIEGAPESPASSPFSPVSPPAKKHFTFETEFEKAQTKDNGVKQLLIIGIVSDISETYDNMQKLLSFLDFQSMSDTIRYAVDLKLANILLGLGGHTSSYPCHICTWKYEMPRKGARQASVATQNPQLRTLGMQRQLATDFEAAKAANPKAHPKDFFSTSRHPLMNDPDNVMTMELVPPGELHLMTGVCNNTIAAMDNCWVPKDSVYDWLKSRGLNPGQFGLVGNDCRDLLNIHLPSLRVAAPDSCEKLIDVLDALKGVKNSMFGKKLLPWYESAAETFKKAFRESGLNEYTKAHIVNDHLVEFCKEEQVGLGVFTEQAGESVHHAFSKEFERFKVSKNNPRFGEQLESAVLKFNWRNLD